ncbi:hypothetical protein WR25_00976 [Diploscapter pachys]|uniref:Disease resistance R13L4/SHOC-2-like LRR domain-containing protein n=1 Tax=Diploscapter pachys TaxID=2018661 RepID=A0A2A2JVS9_9BILA|nr:hypothetical protein WR25_00976 [Diploscapter pachys]
MGNDSSKSSSSGNKLGGLKIGKKSPAHDVQKHLENSWKSRILQLKASNLKNFPEEACQLADILRNIDLSQNKIRILPTAISSFCELRQLHLSGNQLTEIPDEIGSLRKLEVLNLSGNSHISKLPDSLVACNQLKTISLASNAFVEFPSVLCNMLSIEMVDLSQNRIEQLPDEISEIKAQELNLNQNQLNNLNASSLSRNKHLKILRVEENCLAKTEFTQQLLEESTISIIAFRGNLFQDSEFQHLPGYESYQERFTATRRKM